MLTGFFVLTGVFYKQVEKTIFMENKKVTKYEMVDSIRSKIDGVEKSDVLRIVDLFLDEMKTALKNKSVIELRGFGTFEPRLRKGRKDGRNPKSGEPVSVPDRYTVVFRPGQDIRGALKNLTVEENDD